MPNPCPICAKSLPSKSALAQHTGTNKPSTATPHVCPKCAQKFCSVKAMQSHRGAPAHASIFKCRYCPRTFGDKRAVAQHEGSGGHARVGGKTLKEKAGVRAAECESNANVGAIVGGVGRENSDDAGDAYIPFDHNDDDEDSDGNASSPPYRRAVRAYYPGLDDEQDWILCDGDCGWCGHCGDGVDFD